MTIQARFNGYCQACGCAIPAGTKINWVRGAGSTHVTAADCNAARAAKAAAAALTAHADAPAVNTAPAITLDASPIVAFLNAAKARGLKFPKARFLAPDGQRELRLSVSGERSRVPGSINVVVAGEWVGRVCPDGSMNPRLANDAALVATLTKVGTDPAKAAKEYGALMGCCSFCGLPLTDAGSVEVGYGPVCARRWNLPHHPQGTPAVQAVS